MKVIKWTTCDLLAPPDVIKKYVTKNKEPLCNANKSTWTPYFFDLDKVVKSKDLSRRTAKVSWSMRNWGCPENVINSGYIPGSDSVSFWCKGHCPDIAIKKIFSDNPSIPIQFYWFNENDEKGHYYIRQKNGRILIKYGEGQLKAKPHIKKEK